MGKYLCFRCSSELTIDDDFRSSEIGLCPEEKAGTGEDAIVTLMSCPHCGMKYEIYDVPESERDEFPYFSEGVE